MNLYTYTYLLPLLDSKSKVDSFQCIALSLELGFGHELDNNVLVYRQLIISLVVWDTAFILISLSLFSLTHILPVR